MSSISPLLFPTVILLATSPVFAAPSVEQFTLWTDGNNGAQFDALVDFDIVNANSILVATAYLDAAAPPSFTNVRFGDGTGIGSGDVAPDASFIDSRTASYVFINPPTDAGLSFRLDSASGGGIAAILYEVSGANTSLDSITTVTASNAVETTTPDELIISFAGRNGTGTATVNGASIFPDEDVRSSESTFGGVRGGGSLSSASATAPAVGSNDITWNSATEGRIAYAFKAGASIPSPVSLNGFIYDSNDGSSSVNIVGVPGTRYQLVEADDLDFSNPDQNPIPLDGATIGTLDGDVVTTDGNGNATVQFNLGTTKAATFIRAEDAPPPPPLIEENFDGAAGLPAGWVSSGANNGTNWEVGVPSGVSSGPAAPVSAPNCAGTNIGGYYTENTDVTLTTAGISIPAGASASLSFEQLIDTDSAGDSGSVRILDADNADAPIVGLEITGLQGLGSSGAGWTTGMLALPAGDVGGKNIKVQFRFVSDAGSAQDTDVFGGFYIDDVLLSLD